MVNGVQIKGETPPRMMAVVVLYAAVFESTCIDVARRTSDGLTNAALYGPRKAMKPTWTRTAHLSHEGQF